MELKVFSVKLTRLIILRDRESGIKNQVLYSQYKTS
jgi:hypothetical protein